MSRTVAFLLAVSTSLQAPADETIVAVASNFTAPMKAVAAAYEMQSANTVSLAFGSSGKFYAQIVNGAPFQAFFSADQAKPIALEKAGMVVPGSRFTYAIGALALWSAQEDLDGAPEALLKSGQFNKLALANPKLAPYGAAAVEALKSLNLESVTRNKWVLGENISQTRQFVDSGSADLGFVALSQISYLGRVSPGTAWIVPQSLYRPIRQDAVLLRNGENSQATRAFMLFVRSPSARTIVKSYGYNTEYVR